MESHDQALVGDKTLIFRLADSAMYTGMDKTIHNPTIDRAIALHKMIRLFTLAGGGESYLNFMGNEFGHPEWIDFPREGNGWSFDYCRRQWSLVNPYLKYDWLNTFDRDMVALTKDNRIFDQRFGDMCYLNEKDQVCAFSRNGLLFVFNFHHSNSLQSVRISVPGSGEYTVALTSDDKKYSGFQNIEARAYTTMTERNQHFIELYVPARVCLVLREDKRKSEQLSAK